MDESLRSSPLRNEMEGTAERRGSDSGGRDGFANQITGVEGMVRGALPPPRMRLKTAGLLLLRYGIHTGKALEVRNPGSMTPSIP